MQFVVRADCIVHFRRKFLKGLLSIPSHGRGARRPLGQSFRESVGPANVKLSGGTPHSTASQSRNGFEEKKSMRRERVDDRLVLQEQKNHGSEFFQRPHYR